MPFPRISGMLLNCALNCALPNVLHGIQELAQDVEIPHLDSYELLKSKFEQWYGLSLSWQTFHLLLREFSFSDIELIMAPVLRLFISTKCTDAEKERIRDIIKSPYQGIPEDIAAALGNEMAPQTPGKYLPLTNYEANELFYKHFGLFMRVHEFVRDSNDDYMCIDAENDLIKVDVYLKNDHFELQKHLEVPGLNLSPLTEEVKESISSTQCATTTNHALARLIPMIWHKFVKVLDKTSEEFAQGLIDPVTYIQNVEKYKLHTVSKDGKLTFAIVLLTLMENFEETKDYANQKLNESLGISESADIELLLTSSIAEAYKHAHFQKLGTTSSLENPYFTKKTLEKFIPTQVFNDILGSYQTSYWMLNFLTQVFTLGFYKHESNTIKALKTLNKQEFITQKMISDVLSQNTGDSQRARRLSFWNKKNCEKSKEYTATDNILYSLKLQFQ